MSPIRSLFGFMRAYQIAEYTRSLACWQAIFIIAVLYWFQFTPAPNIAMGVLTLATVVMALRDERSRLERVVWIVVAGALFFIEMNAINKDRVQHDEERIEQQARLTSVFVRSQAQFSETLRSIGSVANTAKESVKTAQESIKTMTGGDSYCWLAFSYVEPNQLLFSAVHVGSYPLRNVDISIRDIDLYERTQRERPISISEFLDLAKTRAHLLYLAPHGASVIGPFPINDQAQNFDAQFSSANGFWSELLQRRKIDGKWAVALKVTRWTVDEKGNLVPHILRETIDPNYPKVGGKVEWR